MKKMAKIVDKQNENDANYKKMSEDFENSIAFSVACELVFKGRVQPQDTQSHYYTKKDY